MSLMTTTTHILRSVDASSRNSNIESELLRAMCWSQVSLRRRTFVFFMRYVKELWQNTKRSQTEREREKEGQMTKEKKEKKERVAKCQKTEPPSLFNLRNLEDKKKKERWIIFIWTTLDDRYRHTFGRVRKRRLRRRYSSVHSFDRSIDRLQHRVLYEHFKHFL